ncbi:unnamed protein product, partial [Ectocarpus sp. 4 AP-2014]
TQQPTLQASYPTLWIRPSKTAVGPVGRSVKVRWRQIAEEKIPSAAKLTADEHNLFRVAGTRYCSKNLCS